MLPCICITSSLNAIIISYSA